MKTAKIIRHRHKIVHYVNDEIQSNGIFLEEHYKILFSDPVEMERFQVWVTRYDGHYEWNKETKKVTDDSKTPTIPAYLGEEICYCDCFEYYMQLDGWSLHSTISPYKGHIYTK